ncbi:hypothetical protein [Flavobacterium limi]|uniref:Uncharacterized protein n=1 Tax=Flavobacterium limi TaxID=2045105 RepID=A0ABQ1TL35_9FLAO|nr:hypothetical protein [Flavobacterium limi]GGE98278.1 hypothetical protein GCM10011518_04640 [Flavobacterium limi]
MSTKTIRFLRNIQISPSNDFNQEVVDKIYKGVIKAYNNHSEIEIDDFLSILTIDKLLHKTYVNCIENDLNIVFKKIGLNFLMESDRKSFNVTNIEKFSFRRYAFIAFSENYECYEENDKTINILINGAKTELNIQQLRNMGITHESIDY